MSSASQSLYDPRNGDLALTVSDVTLHAGDPRRTNYFTVDWVRSGRGEFWADSACLPFAAPSLLFFVPYQQTRFAPQGAAACSRLQFHANFLCIETYHEEVGCNGVLFNHLYGVPAVTLDDRHDREFAELFGQIRDELTGCGLAHAEILLSYLKVLLIRATRLKLEQQGDHCGVTGRLPPVLEDLRELIEARYSRLHTPADYARLLHADPKALGRTVKAHLGKTLTEVIRERILKHAKWDLLHTLKPVKQIAHELGYGDELYFSRLFKRGTGLSPVFFREFETAIRGGRNLSMSSPLPSIPGPAESTDHALRSGGEP